MRTQLLGRGPELAALREARDALTAGRGGAVLIAGEPGIGKSALLDAACAEAGAPVLRGRALPDDGVPAGYPWLRALAAGVDLGLSPDLLASGPLAGGAFDPPAAARFRAMERTVDALATAARPDGLVLAFDDLHWADPESVRLLRHLLGELAGSRVLLLGTLRDAEAPDGLRDLLGHPDLRLLRPPPLSAAQVGEYAHAHSTQWTPDSAWTAEAYRLSGGNPLFLRELVRAVDRAGGPDRAGTLPAELGRLLAYRLAGLGRHCRDVLGACAVLGDELDPTVLATLGIPDLDAGLAEAATAGVLVPDPDRPYLLRFAHGLIRQARYDALTPAERARWHGRVADALSRPDGGRAAEVARHRVAAAVDPEGARRAAGAVRVAAQVAAQRAALDDAIRLGTQECDLLERSAAGPAERAGALLRLAEALHRAGQVAAALERCEAAADLADEPGVDPERRTELVVRAALVVRHVAGPVVVAVDALCRRARALVPPDSDATHALLLARQAQALVELGATADARALAGRALDLAERSGDPAALVAAIHSRYAHTYLPDSSAERLALVNRLLATGEAAGDPEAVLWARIWRVDTTLQLGAFAETDREIAALGVLVSRLGWPLARWHLLRARAARALIAGQLGQAEELIDEAAAVAAATEDGSAQAVGYSLRSDLYALTGRLAEMVPVLDRLRAGQLTVPMATPIVAAQFGGHLADAGEHDAARELLDAARPQLPRLGPDSRYLPVVSACGGLAAILGDLDTVAWCYERTLPYDTTLLYSASGCAGAVARRLGVMAAALGRLDDAVRHLREAEALERRAGGLTFLAVTQLELARVLSGRAGPGDRDGALALAERAGAAARRMGLRPTAERAATLAGELTGVNAGPGSLTGREREIAGLLADGRSNREIATALVLSERTVETHVRSILAKLGLANRTQVAAWALRVGLRTGSA